MVIENSLPDFWIANTYYHGFEDASDRLANNPDSPGGQVGVQATGKHAIINGKSV